MVPEFGPELIAGLTTFIGFMSVPRGDKQPG
jgi:hypothetical protein